jgi:uncharacterized protein YggE
VEDGKGAVAQLAAARVQKQMKPREMGNNAMKTKVILSFTTAATALGLVCLANTVAWGADENPMRSISVSGTVETKVAPDQILWHISFTATDTNLSKAKAQSDQQVKSVVALRAKLGIGEGDLETGPVSVSREYERDQRGVRGNFKYFVVNRSVTIRERDLKRFDEFLDTLVSSTEMEVYFNFESSHIRDIRVDTRLKALQAAKQKAMAMAEAAGAKLGRVWSINEHSASDSGRSAMSNSNISYAQSTPPPDLATETFVPGAISVPVTVYVTYELQ